MNDVTKENGRILVFFDQTQNNIERRKYRLLRCQHTQLINSPRVNDSISRKSNVFKALKNNGWFLRKTSSTQCNERFKSGKTPRISTLYTFEIYLLHLHMTYDNYRLTHLRRTTPGQPIISLWGNFKHVQLHWMGLLNHMGRLLSTCARQIFLLFYWFNDWEIQQ